jgi:hypothetical protein
VRVYVGFRTVTRVQADIVQEPGLDQHEWQTQWEALEPELSDAPAEALPEANRLIEQMLSERGYEDGPDPEIERELEGVRELVARIDAGEAVDPGDVGAAVKSIRNVYEQLLAERRVP